MRAQLATFFSKFVTTSFNLVQVSIFENFVKLWDLRQVEVQLTETLQTFGWSVRNCAQLCTVSSLSDFSKVCETCQNQVRSILTTLDISCDMWPEYPVTLFLWYTGSGGNPVTIGKTLGKHKQNLDVLKYWKHSRISLVVSWIQMFHQYIYC